MIRSLRVRHRRMIVIVAVVTAALALAAWISREPVPVVERLPSVGLDAGGRP